MCTSLQKLWHQAFDVDESVEFEKEFRAYPLFCHNTRESSLLQNDLFFYATRNYLRILLET